MSLRMRLCYVLLLTVWLASPAWSRNIDRTSLKTGMSLPEVVEAIGQPARMEWVNIRGQAVLFVFYDTNGKDVVKLSDGQSYLPLGFVTERLAGWGKKFYEQITRPE